MGTFMIIACLLSLLVMLFAKDIAGISTLGWPKSDEVYLEIVQKMKSRNIKLINDMGHKGFITCLSDDLPYISGSITGITFGYYVSGYGIVPRWYKSHKEITEIFNQLENK
jgi:uncharacterized membrane protein